MKTYYILALIFITAAKGTFAQDRIQGKVIDQDSIGLPFSLILLKKQKEIVDYCFSDVDGSFIIPQEKRKGMYLEVHFFDFSDTIKIDSSMTNLMVQVNIQEKVSQEQLREWMEEMYRKYNLEYKDE